MPRPPRCFSEGFYHLASHASDDRCLFLSDDDRRVFLERLALTLERFELPLVAYTLMTLAAFALLAAKGRDGEREVLIDDLAGLAQRRPWAAFALAVCMLSLLGFPGTAGFIGKWYILVAATQAGQHVLAAALVLTSVLSAVYYLPVIMAMYMKPEPFAEAHSGMRLGVFGRTAVLVSVVGLLYLGVRPNRLLDIARTSGAAVRSAPPATSGTPLPPRTSLGN